MTPTTDAANLQYHERRFSLIVDEILFFASSTDFVIKVNNFIMMFNG